MKRIEMCHKINRNYTETRNDVYKSYANSLRVNVIDPEKIGNENWIVHNEATGVDIYELNDSDFSKTSEETPQYNLNRTWSYVNNTITPPQQLQNNYKVNNNAREWRRLRENVRQNFTVSASDYVSNNNFSDVIDTPTSDYKNKVKLNHNINCFTIINKHFTNSDTSSENTDYGVIEPSRPIGDGIKENYYNKIFGDETLTYNSDRDAEKRTIWIHSFKNKRLLSDDCIEMVNVPSNESTNSSTSFSFEKIEDNEDNITRAASPIPLPYIPRLNLSLGQTLSTVTEVTEPNKQPSSIDTKRFTKFLVQKPKNTWFLNKDSNNCCNKQDKSSNIVNWMALSPRERRRLFRHKDSNSDVIYDGEVCPKAESKILCEQGKDGDIEMYNDIHPKTVDVDIHVCRPSLSETFKVESKKDPTTNQTEVNNLEVSANEDIVEVSDEETMQEFIKCPHKPQIKISQKSVTNTRNITDPLEKLNTDNWIMEDTEKETAAYSYDLERIDESGSSEVQYILTANDRLWSKNIKALMKPAQWNEYAPIAESHLSLCLSLDSTVRKQTCLSRLINLFKCCN